jgi:hypothetical protein
MSESGQSLPFLGTQSKGDRVKITMRGKFLPHEYCGASGNVPELQVQGRIVSAVIASEAKQSMVLPRK